MDMFRALQTLRETLTNPHKGANQMYFNTQTGQPLKPKVYLVCGAPGSGKTTYVMQHKEPGDFILDLDLIRQALGAPQKTDECFQQQVLLIRDLLYTEIQFNHIGCKNIWVISGLPDRYERASVAQRLGAEVIFVKTKKIDCIRRVMRDDSRKDKAKQLNIINEYFDRLEE